jgi:hypothetical protein
MPMTSMLLAHAGVEEALEGRVAAVSTKVTLMHVVHACAKMIPYESMQP